MTSERGPKFSKRLYLLFLLQSQENCVLMQSLLLNNFKYVSSLGGGMCVGILVSVISSRTGVIGGCETLDIGTGNLTQDFCKSIINLAAKPSLQHH